MPPQCHPSQGPSLRNPAACTSTAHSDSETVHSDYKHGHRGCSNPCSSDVCVAAGGAGPSGPANETSVPSASPPWHNQTSRAKPRVKNPRARCSHPQVRRWHLGPQVRCSFPKGGISQRCLNWIMLRICPRGSKQKEAVHLSRWKKKEGIHFVYIS